MGNDSSQYGRVEGAVSGCRPAGPQNVGQVVSVCLACTPPVLGGISPKEDLKEELQKLIQMFFSS